MKLNASINLQNNTWQGTKRHILRTFEDIKNGTQHDRNKDINTNLSTLNLSTDGKLINLPNNKKKFIYNTINLQQIHNNFINNVNNQYSKFIQHHNNLKSVKKNPSRKYKSAYNYLFKKNNKNPIKELEKHEKTFSLPIGNADSNYKIIRLIQHKRHWSFIQARNSYLKIMSETIYTAQSEWNKSHKYIKLLHFGTNVDESIRPNSELPDALHSQGSLIGLGLTKTGRPTLNFGKALCNEEHIKWKNKRTKKHNHYINISEAKALSKFNDQEAKRQLWYISKFLYQKYHISKFKNIHFSRTHSTHTGQSQKQYQYHREQHRQAHIRRIKYQRIRKYMCYKRKKNTRNRVKTYHRQYMKHYRAMKLVNHRINELKYQVSKQKQLSQNYKLAIQDQRYKYINYLQKTKIEKDKQQNLKTITTRFINQKKHQLKIFANNLLTSTRQTLRQNANDNISNLTALRSANNRTITRANKTAQTGIFGRIKSTFQAIKSNYKSNSFAKSLSNSKSNSFNSTINSIAEPISIRRANYEERIHKLEQADHGSGLYMNQSKELQSLLANPPMTVAEYSNSIQSTEGMNLIRSSISSASSYSQALPSIKASQQARSQSLNIYWQKLYQKRKAERKRANKAFDQKQAVKRKYNKQKYEQNKKWINKHPHQAQQARNKHLNGPTI